MNEKVQGFKIAKMTKEEFHALPEISPEIYFNESGVPFFIMNGHVLRGQTALTPTYEVNRLSRIELQVYGQIEDA